MSEAKVVEVDGKKYVVSEEGTNVFHAMVEAIGNAILDTIKPHFLMTEDGIKLMFSKSYDRNPGTRMPVYIMLGTPGRATMTLAALQDFRVMKEVEEAKEGGQ